MTATNRSVLNHAEQQRINSAKIAIFGLNGPGSVAAKTLAQAGIGELVLIDTSPKLLAGLKRILINSSDTNSNQKITLFAKSLTDKQTEQLLGECSLVIDALPDWQEKLHLSDTCMRTQTPLIHAGVAGFRFQIFSMLPLKSACLRCALPMSGIDDVPLEPPDTNSLAAVVEMVGAWQSIEAIKIIARIGATQGNELFKFDCLSGEFEVVRGLDPQPDCPDCGNKGNSHNRA